MLYKAGLHFSLYLFVMNKLVFLFLLVIASIAKQSYAQQNKIDSLLTLIKTDKEDTNKVNHINNLSREYILTNEDDKGLVYAKQALALAQNVGFKKGKAVSFYYIGNIYRDQGNYADALKNYYASLEIREDIKDKKNIAQCYNNIGTVYHSEGNHSDALKNYYASLKIREEIKDKKGISGSYNNIGAVYYEQANYPETLKNYAASLKIKEELKDNFGLSQSYNNIGLVNFRLGNYSEALKNYLDALKIEEELKDKQGIASSYNNIGYLYTKENKAKEAATYLNRGLQLSTEIGNKAITRGSYKGLALLDSTMGNYKAAFEHYKLFIVYRDSLTNEETKKKSLQAGMQYEFDKKEMAAKAEQDKLDAINKEEKKKQGIIIYAVAGLLILVAVFAVFMYSRFRITHRQKIIIENQKVTVDKAYEELHEKNKEVMDSIHYAKRIQNALITSERYIGNALERLNKF